MKTIKQLTVLLASVYFLAACSKAASQSVMNGNGQAVVPPVIIDPWNPGAGANSNLTLAGGSTTTFNPVNLTVMNEYVATHPLNNPTNFKVNVNLTQVSGGKYGGEVSISYNDNGLAYNGVFKSGLGKNQPFKGMYDNNKLESEYNFWFNRKNQTVFSGFFEDQYGAIVVTLEPISSAPASGNDGEPVLNQGYKGRIYFKNFAVTPAPHSPYRACWFKYMGPYDCRSNIVQTKCDLYPGIEAGYKLLGTFQNIDVKKAFNIQ